MLTFGLLLVVYLGWQFSQILAPPYLEVYEPADGLVVTTRQVVIRGQVEPESELRMNHEVILPESTGSFTQLVNLHPGLNIFVFEAKRRYGRTNSLVREVHLREEPVVKETKSEKRKVKNDS